MESLLIKPEGVPIKKIGDYFEIDEDGYVVNPTSKEKIQEIWRPVITDVIASYQKHCGDKLHSIYLRGSVARGTAIQNVSDLDTFSYVNMPREDISYDWLGEAEHEITAKYPFTQGIEMNMDSIHNVETNKVMLEQSVCIYGPDLTKNMPRLRPGKDMVVHAYSISENISWLRDKLNTFESPDVKEKCIWLMKLFLRTGFELVMGRANTYTRDLYPCYETFVLYYPEKEPEMREVLNLALNPTDDTKRLLKILEDLGSWLEHEAKIVYPSEK